MNRAEDVIDKHLIDLDAEGYSIAKHRQLFASSIAAKLRAAGLLNEWVSVEERLPTPGEWVLCWLTTESPCIGQITIQEGDWFINHWKIERDEKGRDTVTHWQAIAPPKE